MFNKIAQLFKKFYFVTLALFLVWMIFFDQNDFISQYRMNKKLDDLEKEYSYYSEKMPEVEKEAQALKNNSAQLEKFYKEKYKKKKKTEEVFIIQREE